MANSVGGGTPRARGNIHKPKHRYSLRVEREIKHPQPQLLRPLEVLIEGTNNLIEYKKLGELAATVIELDPIVRDVCECGPKGKIVKESAQNLETELREIAANKQFLDKVEKLENEDLRQEIVEAMGNASYGNIDVDVDQIFALDLYGNNEDKLAIALNPRDLRLAGERGAIEQYLRLEYNISDNQMRKMLKPFDPHITIGRVKYESFDDNYEKDKFKEDPHRYLADYARERFFAEHEKYAVEEREFIMPDSVCLNGLRIFIENRRHKLRTNAA